MEVTITIASPETLKLLHAALEWGQDSIDEEFSDGTGQRTPLQYDYISVTEQIARLAGA